jgi:hypothetical protein
MYSLFLLKEKNDNNVIYYYSIDKKDAPSDGEIEYDKQTDKFKTLKNATGDDDGFHAKWFSGHLRRVILKEGCPARKFVAIG